jgi:hypothetical protein
LARARYTARPSRATLSAEELDWLPKFYNVFENPSGTNKSIVTLPMTGPSVARL